MTSVLRRWADSWMGRGDAAPTVPPMDGALHPNQALEEATCLTRIPAPDNLVSTPEGLWFSSGADLYRLEPGAAPERVRSYAAPIACLAATEGLFAVGLENGEVHLSKDDTPLTRLVCPTALAFSDRGGLLVCEGSTAHGPQHWRRDLMTHGASGRVLRLETGSGDAKVLAKGLRYPSGVVETGGDVVVAEAWAARLLRLAENVSEALLYDLPGYPSRLVPATRGGYWLCIFAPRSQLVELVLRERAYCRRMMAEVEERYWVAPSLSAAASYLEPLQGGAIRTHGIIKPWSPTRSYGLLVRLDDSFRPVESWHSRADGTRHGITSCAEWQGVAHVTSKGGDALLRINPAGEEAT